MPQCENMYYYLTFTLISLRPERSFGFTIEVESESFVISAPRRTAFQLQSRLLTAVLVTWIGTHLVICALKLKTKPRRRADAHDGLLLCVTVWYCVLWIYIYHENGFHSIQSWKTTGDNSKQQQQQQRRPLKWTRRETIFFTVEGPQHHSDLYPNPPLPSTHHPPPTTLHPPSSTHHPPTSFCVTPPGSPCVRW